MESKFLIDTFPPSYKEKISLYDFDNQIYQYMQNKNNKSNYSCAKCIIVGNVGVGKTSILKRFGSNEFTENYKLTIGVDFDIHDFKILGQSFKLHVWDTAGEERFKSITQTYYRNSHIALIVFDFSSINTLSSIKQWSNEILSLACCKNNLTGQLDEPILVLVGTKKDLISESTFEFIEQEAIKLAKEIKARFWAVSAKTGENINELFRSIAALAFSEITLREIEVIEHAKKVLTKNYANNFLNQQLSNEAIKLKKSKKQKFKGLNKKIFKIKCFK